MLFSHFIQLISLSKFNMLLILEINSAPFLTAVALGLLTAYFLNIHSRPSAPELHFLHSELNLKILEKCDILFQK